MSRKDLEVKPAPLTKRKILFLKGLADPTPNFARVMKHRITSKLKIFINLKLPTPQRSLGNLTSSQEALKPIINAGINAVNASSNASNNDPKTAVDEVVRSPGFEPGSRAWKARILVQAVRFGALDDDRYQMVDG